MLGEEPGQPERKSVQPSLKCVLIAGWRAFRCSSLSYSTPTERQCSATVSNDKMITTCCLAEIAEIFFFLFFFWYLSNEGATTSLLNWLQQSRNLQSLYSQYQCYKKKKNKHKKPHKGPSKQGTASLCYIYSPESTCGTESSMWTYFERPEMSESCGYTSRGKYWAHFKTWNKQQ